MMKTWTNVWIRETASKRRPRLATATPMAWHSARWGRFLGVYEPNDVTAPVASGSVGGAGLGPGQSRRAKSGVAEGERTHGENACFPRAASGSHGGAGLGPAEPR